MGKPDTPQERKPSPAEALLAENIRRLMRDHVELNSSAKLAKACEMDTTTVNRILKGSHSTSLDKIERIANAYGVHVSALLSPPGDQPAASWPFRLVSEARYMALDELSRGAAQAAMSEKIKEIELVVNGASLLKSKHRKAA